MSGTSRALLVAVGVSFLLASASQSAIKTRPKKRKKPGSGRAAVTAAPQHGRQAKPSSKHQSSAKADLQKEQLPASKYDQLLVKYLRNIDRVRRERHQASIREYQARMRRFQEASEQLKDKESELFDSLRKEAEMRRGKKLNFEGECYENRNGVLVPVSEVSGRAFRKLYQLDAVEPVIMQRLCKDAQVLSAEWIELVKQIAAGAKEGSVLWRQCIRTLRRAGVSRKSYGRLLRKMADKDNDVQALEEVFFDVNLQTGQLQKVVTHENIVLLKKLAAKDRPPGIRVTCAHFAAKIRDYDLAQSVCLDLLSRPYKGLEQRVSGGLPEDRPLAYARRRAMVLMFWELRNEKSFKTIYDRSRISNSEMREHVGDLDGKTGWVSFTSYLLAEMEVSHARSLVATVDKFSSGEE